jgi:hypothetical protein
MLCRASDALFGRGRPGQRGPGNPLHGAGATHARRFGKPAIEGQEHVYSCRTAQLYTNARESGDAAPLIAGHIVEPVAPGEVVTPLIAPAPPNIAAKPADLKRGHNPKGGKGKGKGRGDGANRSKFTQQTCYLQSDEYEVRYRQSGHAAVETQLRRRCARMRVPFAMTASHQWWLWMCPPRIRVCLIFVYRRQ